MIAKMRIGGEACTAANRICVQRGAADEFSRLLAEKMSAMKDWRRCEWRYRCRSSRELHRCQQGQRTRRRRSPAQGISSMRRQAHGQRRALFPADSLLEVPSDAAIAHEEIFGPVAPIYVFDKGEKQSSSPTRRNTSSQTRPAPSAASNRAALAAKALTTGCSNSWRQNTSQSAGKAVATTDRCGGSLPAACRQPSTVRNVAQAHRSANEKRRPNRRRRKSI